MERILNLRDYAPFDFQETIRHCMENIWHHMERIFDTAWRGYSPLHQEDISWHPERGFNVHLGSSVKIISFVNVISMNNGVSMNNVVSMYVVVMFNLVLSVNVISFANVSSMYKVVSTWRHFERIYNAASQELCTGIRSHEQSSLDL
jgi:hypothetical protein